MNKLTPQKLGNYDIIERLGRGGMAEVYKGHHSTLDRFVAIKVLHRHLSDTQDLIERFKLEARAIAKLQHPHIMRLIDFDAQGDEFYMVLEYLEGGNLKTYLKQEGTLPPQEALRLAAQLLSGLDYAHRQGMIHRDIKSANVLFMDDSHSHAVLADFGLARILDETGLTVSGTMLGTPSYMSPEAARGERLDERADIYSFGIVLYEMVTGTTPYTADTPYAVLLKHIQEALPSPLQFNPNVPPIVEEILFKALAKKPEERFQSAREFGIAIEGALQELNPSTHIFHHSLPETRGRGGAPPGHSLLPRDKDKGAIYPSPVTPPTRVRAGSQGKEEGAITISIPRRRMRVIAAIGLSLIIGAILIMVVLFRFEGEEGGNRENNLNPSPTIEGVVEEPSEEDFPPEEEPPEEEPPQQKPRADSPAKLFDETNPDPTVLLYSNLASPQQIKAPTVGQGGMSKLEAQDFVSGQHDKGVLLVREGENCENERYQLIRFPMITKEKENISFDEGEIELWYRPNYDSDDVSRQRVLVAIGYNNIYNPPTMLLEMRDRLSFSITEQDYTSFAAETSYAPSLWKADDWVHIRARWDSKGEGNALQLFVNGKHVNQTSQGGWDIKPKAEDRENSNIFVGSGTACGDFIADGIIDEILIRDKAERIN